MVRGCLQHSVGQHGRRHIMLPPARSSSRAAAAGMPWQQQSSNMSHVSASTHTNTHTALLHPVSSYTPAAKAFGHRIRPLPQLPTTNPTEHHTPV